MPLFPRPDGKLVKDVAAYRRIMPYIMRSRTESAVYFEQEIDLSHTLPFIDRFNTAHPERRVTVFHVFLWAAVRALHERPRLNRFTSGGRVYQRDGIWISYSAKKAMRDDAPVVVLKRRFDPCSSFEALVEEMYRDLEVGRSERESHVDKELSVLLRLPGPLLRVVTGLQRWLDRWNLLPGSFIRTDPLYASLFIANLGSVRLDSAYHHLYEYGNIPIFAVIGRKRVVPSVEGYGRVATRTVCSVKYTLDERVEDGLYCAGALERLRELIENPEAAPEALTAGAAAG